MLNSLRVIHPSWRRKGREFFKASEWHFVKYEQGHEKRQKKTSQLTYKIPLLEEEKEGSF